MFVCVCLKVLHKLEWAGFTWVQICREDCRSQTIWQSKHPSCNLNAIMDPPSSSSVVYCAEVNDGGVSSSSPARKLVFLSESLAPVSNPVTCASYYWTLFHQQSRKEERRGALIAHLNGGCHIINAYRPTLRPVTETPSHSSKQKEGE